MKKQYPSTRTLTARLPLMLARGGLADADIEIVDRSPAMSSTFPTDIVTCRLGTSGTVRLLCKYSHPHRHHLPAWHTAHGHRHGVAYEARVYRHVLAPLGLTTPRVFGTYQGKGRRGWLAVEYLDGSLHINSTPSDLASAAEWIGLFHARNVPRLSERRVRFLSTYTADYYRGWAQRTLKYARRFRRGCAALEALTTQYETVIDTLVEPPLTIIHGEYYPANVRWHRGDVYPVDWETAAIGAGEIDLACLTENWPEEFAQRCERAYIQARWPDGCDHTVFRRRLSAARLYMTLRWTGVPRTLASPADRAYYLKRITAELGR